MVAVFVLVGMLAVSAFEVPLLFNPQRSLTTSEVNGFYTCILYVGTPPEPFTFVLVHFKAITVLTDASCSAPCSSNKGFNSSQSKSFEETNQVDHNERLVSDVITWNPMEPPVARIHFLLWNFTTLRADGVLVSSMQGLGLPEKSESAYTFLASLKKSSVITTKVFVLYLSDNDDFQSSISFGSSNLTKYAEGSDFTYVNILGNNEDIPGSWNVQFKDISFGDFYWAVPSSAIFMLDVPYLILPRSVYSAVQEIICNQVVCNTDESVLKFPCSKNEDSELPDIVFTLGTTEFPVSPQFYIYKINDLCTVKISKHKSHFYILGTPFMKAYYMMFDVENLNVGLVRSVNNSHAKQSPDSLWMWVIIVVTVTVIGVMISTFLVYRRKKEMEQDKIEPLMNRDE